MSPALMRWLGLTQLLLPPEFLQCRQLWVVRQSFIHEGIYLNYHEMHRRMKDHEASKALPAKVAQWVLRLLGD
jgi:hypothetical protein